MNIHEYQAKKLFAEAGVAVPNGTVAQSEPEFDQALSSLPEGKPIVVKAQIHAGGRGKGTFKDGYQGGVHIVHSSDDAKEKAKAMLGNVLVTKQTGEEGKEVSTVYFNEATDIEKEYYMMCPKDLKKKINETVKLLIVCLLVRVFYLGSSFHFSSVVRW